MHMVILTYGRTKLCVEVSSRLIIHTYHHNQMFWREIEGFPSLPEYLRGNYRVFKKCLNHLTEIVWPFEAKSMEVGGKGDLNWLYFIFKYPNRREAMRGSC